PSPEQLARQAKQHLDSLRAAGVEWLPKAPPPEAAPEPPPPAAAPAPGPGPSLFADLAPDEGRPVLSLAPRRPEAALGAEGVAACTRCAQLEATRTQTVFGVGKLDAEICFIGEAPGADEDRQGEPFVGPAGQLLNRIIAACGMKREEVFICNILRCR